MSAIGTSGKSYGQEAFEAIKHAHELVDGLEDCREKSLSLTKLEEAAMWLSKGRVNQGELEPNETHI